MSIIFNLFKLTTPALVALAAFSSFMPALASNNAAAIGISPSTVKTPSGVVYQLFPQGKFAFDFVVARPSTNDNSIVFCMPAAFTKHNNKVDGAFISNGLAINGAVNDELGGAMLIKKGQCQLLATNKGETITPDFLNSALQEESSLFQQFLIVHNKKAAVFRDKSKFQRRAICQKKDDTFAIIESDKAITFDTFNNDLVALDIKNALYADMGAWDEGWYRSSLGAVIKTGLDRSQTQRQSNWLLLRKNKSQ